MARIKGWQVIIDRFKRHLASWKVKLLSIGGKLTLLKFVLGSLGIFFLSIFRITVIVCRLFEALRERFFRGIEEGHNRIHWVNWNLILNSHE